MARAAPLLISVPPAVPSEAARSARGQAFVRAQVFLPQPPDIEQLDLKQHAMDERPFAPEAPLTCRFVPEPVKGTTPKFACELADGEIVKIKYGRTPEIPAEIGATRLLSALGLASDRVSFVRTLHCAGCPPSPFRLRQFAETMLLARLFEQAVDYGTTRTFEDVAVERKFPGTPIEAESIEGWDFTELTSIDPSKGGASRDEIDALRLVAVLLAHWDNKGSNQRLVCLDEIPKDISTSCARPLLMLQDLGATFGPSKTNLERWSAAPIWEDEATCRTGMMSLPYQGALFRPVQISEGGRTRLADILRRLTRTQMRNLFEHAGFETSGEVPETWAAVLERKIHTIVDRAPCPST